MSSIFRRILVWSVATIALTLLGILAISFVLSRLRSPGVDFMARTLDLQQEMAQRTLAENGRTGLAPYLQRLDVLFEAHHSLIDRTGRDLLTGADRSELLSAVGPPGHPPGFYKGVFVIAGPENGAASRLLVVVPPHWGLLGLLPYLIWVVLVIASMGYALALHIARPLNRLRNGVERFGAGDLATRVGSKRGDEIGQVSRSFDEMAARIETLLAAERRLLQDVSHELRSPLARLGFAIELARSSAATGATLDRIARDVQRISTLVSELLDLTRAEGDPAARGHDRLELGPLLEDMIEDTFIEANARGCRIASRIDPGAAIQGDPELIRRAIENVVRNALRFSVTGSTITIDVIDNPLHGNLLIEIRDHGSGVPEDALDAIFEPFYRVEDDRSRASGGAGLGLAIARRAIHLHGGTIKAANAQPGLRMVIQLPRAACENR